MRIIDLAPTVLIACCCFWVGIFAKKQDWVELGMAMLLVTIISLMASVLWVGVNNG
jgi:membrane-associated HD superfamily phosphohydrolase